jgi:hypothetical protein
MITDPANPSNIPVLKLIQIVNQLGFFLLPVFLFALLTSGNVFKYLRLDVAPKRAITWLGIGLLFVSMPFVAWLIDWNEGLSLPGWMAGTELWMRNKEDLAMQLTDAFLSTSSIGGFTVNILMMAVLPAIGEELLFRGVLQRLLSEWLRNTHLAIIIAALLFSAIHLQFYGFIPRFILGLAMGYAFFWSRSLWLPIAMHFINNALAVVASFLFERGMTRMDYDEIGGSPSAPIVVMSIAISLVVIVLMYRSSKIGSGEIASGKNDSTPA